MNGSRFEQRVHATLPLTRPACVVGGTLRILSTHVMTRPRKDEACAPPLSPGDPLRTVPHGAARCSHDLVRQVGENSQMKL